MPPKFAPMGLTPRACGGLQKTSGKAPVIHPGDEPPCLVGAGRGGPEDRACRVLDNRQHGEDHRTKVQRFTEKASSDGQESTTQHRPANTRAQTDLSAGTAASGDLQPGETPPRPSGSRAPVV